ncbi:MAG: hypothetical protein IJZ42_10340 [Lachnospiraceae bacterium]|nr:hypothetical protein [Lachnospiraceae bacterium]
MQYNKHKKAKDIFKEIDKNPENYLIVHYSCESFYNIADGHTPRITSIAVYSYASAQTDSFSIHKIAEKMHISMLEIESRYDELEKKMLDEYFEYIREHKNYKWIHWNMRDINYGFKAIEHRYEVLGGEPINVDDSNKIDLSRLFIQCYGVNYIEHPRMEKLLLLNNIQAKDYLKGADEAAAFAAKEYIKLHQSTLRKVDVFADLLNRAIQNTLKVKSKWYEIHGISPQGIFDFCRDRWWIQCIMYVITLALGAIVGKLF